MDEWPWNPRAIYMKSLQVGQMTKLPLEHKIRYTQDGQVTILFIGRPRLRCSLCPSDKSPAIPSRVPRHRSFSARRIPSPPVEPPILVLWLNQVTQQFCGDPPLTPRADSCREPLPSTRSCPRLHLAFLAIVRPSLDPIRPAGPSSRAYLSLHSSKASQG
jgi:hypothetical protein